MARVTGTYQVTTAGQEQVRAFVPFALPPKDPPLVLDAKIEKALADAMAALGRLAVAGTMVPSADWFLYGFVRKEAVISSQIEGTQATLQDVLAFEATQTTDYPEDVQEVCNYVEALTYARRQRGPPQGTAPEFAPAVRGPQTRDIVTVYRPAHDVTGYGVRVREEGCLIGGRSGLSLQGYGCCRGSGQRVRRADRPAAAGQCHPVRRTLRTGHARVRSCSKRISNCERLIARNRRSHRGATTLPPADGQRRLAPATERAGRPGPGPAAGQ